MDCKSLSMKWLLLLTTFAVIAVLGGVPCLGQDPDAPIAAPANSEFMQYLDSPVQMAPCAEFDRILSGLVPEPIDLSHLNFAPHVSFSKAPLPATYDLRGQGRLTAIKDQANCGSCWAFASIGSLESSLMPGELWDFSENNLKDKHGFDPTCCNGGNRTMSTAYLVRWGGAVNEGDDPYNPISCYSPTEVFATKHVQDVIFIPDRTSSLDNAGIKQAVMSYGAIYTTYYHSNNYYKSPTKAYYYNSGGRANHAVCIVGWDDNFSKTNFAIAPPGDGAFIVRNSWGTYWGDRGYFYISYYDTFVGSQNAAFLAEDNTNYDTIYQYDPLGWIGSMGYGSDTAWFSNVFAASSEGFLSAVGCYTASPNSTYDLYVYTGLAYTPTNSAGPVASQSGTISTAGYHTIKLNSPVVIQAGRKFSVVVKLRTPNYSYPVPLEWRYYGYTSGAAANIGESFMSRDGITWTDLAGYYGSTSVCLKAYANRMDTGDGILSIEPQEGLSPTGAVGGPFTPAAQEYTLTNSGAGPFNWTASKTQPWVTLSSTSGSLSPEASSTVTVSINSAANSLSPGTYFDTVTFKNTTTNRGNTSVNVTLKVSGIGILSVSPATELIASGLAGGPFSPASQSYTLTNTGSASLDWTASKAQSWITLAPASGSLSPGDSTTVVVSINSSANSLSPGVYNDSVAFKNTTNSKGDTARNISLKVNNAGSLNVSPSTGLSSSGSTGGPFTPSNQAYTLTNSGGTSLSWTAAKTESWVTLSSASGILQPGASATVTVAIGSGAALLAPGEYSDTVTFTNTTSGGSISRSVDLTVIGGGIIAYRVTPTTYSWVNPTYRSTLRLADNYCSYPQNLPFGFNFYGKTYNKLYVGSNGLVGFALAGMYGSGNTSLPDSYVPNGIICPYWDDLDPNAGGTIEIGTVGSAPNRRVVVSWIGVPHHLNTAVKFTFQMILCEGSDNIIFQYKDVAPSNLVYGKGRSATIGIEDEKGLNACRYSFNAPSLAANNIALLFTTH